MMKKDNTLRMALSGALMLAVVAAGVTMYREESSTEKSKEEKSITPISIRLSEVSREESARF